MNPTTIQARPRSSLLSQPGDIGHITMSKNQVSTVDIYTEYVRLRQGGWTSDDAVRQLTPMADELSASERQQLSKLVQAWEARDGLNYDASAQADNTEQEPTSGSRGNVGLQRQDADKKPALRRLESAPRQEPAIRKIEPVGPVGDPAQRQICPNCGKPNHKMDTYCYACGHILESARRPGTRAFEDSELDSRTRWGTAHFGQFSTIQLTIRGVARPLDLAIQGEAIIGRSDRDSSMKPDIDLAAFNAEELGVSRLHAVLKRQENTVSISDLNSRNNTYINGQRLHPNEVRALRDGDEIRLGRLTMKVTFKHQVRRLQER